MKNYYLLSFLFLMPLFVMAQGQSFAAHYTTDSYLYTKDGFKEFVSSLGDVKPFAAKVITSERFVVANDNYMKIKMVFSINNEKGKEVKQDSSVLKIDKKRLLVYDEAEKKFFKIKKFDVSDSGHVLEVIAEDNSSFVFADPNTPGLIMPFFNENIGINGGVNVVFNKNAVTRLIGWEKSTENIDYSGLFNSIKDIDGLEELSFF